MSYVGKITDTSGNTGLVGSTLYGTCSTGASTAAKVVTCSDFDKLLTGVTIHVKFTNSNTASTPTLNVNSTGAKNIYKYGTTKPGTTAATSWYAGSVVSFTYDGSYWQMNDHIDDTNTNNAVTQTETTTNADYEVTFAGSTGTTTTTEDVGKSQYFTFNPSKKAFTFGTRKSDSTVGNYSVAMGYGATASGYSSYAEGFYTIANHEFQHAFGEYNIEDPSTADAGEKGNYIEIVGNGLSPSVRSNARTLDWDGTEWLAGNLDLGGTSSDITLSGTDNTWDGTNTSLKSAISSLNSSIENLEYDTGWKNNTGWGMYRRIGKMVYVIFGGAPVSARTWYGVTTLPEGCRPSQEINAACVGGDHRQYCGVVQAQTSGMVRIYANTASNYWGTISFPVN